MFQDNKLGKQADKNAYPAVQRLQCRILLLWEALKEKAKACHLEQLTQP